jgi:hypothetical protein
MRESVFKTDEKNVAWLLESSNPSVRYRTLLDIIKLPETHPDVVEAKRAIQCSPEVRQLMINQLSDGSWRGERGDVWDEKGTVFSLLILGELGTEASNVTESALNHLHENYQLPSGRITYRRIHRLGERERSSTWMWCITAAVLRAGIMLGHLSHPVVQNAIGFFEENYREEGGWYCSAYSGNSTKVRPPNCYMGSIKALGAFSIIPRQKRSRKLEGIISDQIKLCLKNQVGFYRVNPKGESVMKRSWLKFAFPRYWRSDLLEALDTLTTLGIQDARMEKAVTIVRQKMQQEGKWLMDFSETKKAWVPLEIVGMPSKWITLRALRVLQYASLKRIDP